MEEDLEKSQQSIKDRIKWMRVNMKISPAIEIIILKEAELAFQAGAKHVLESWEEEQNKFLQGFAYKKPVK